MREVVRTVHSRRVHAAPERVMAAVRALDLGRSPVVRTLFTFRGLGNHLTLDHLRRIGFVPVTDEQDRLEVGLIGRFWTPSGGVRRVDGPTFHDFTEPGYAKAVWGFGVRPGERGRTRLDTWTAVWCTDDGAARRFRVYWALVGPFSGFVRREALRLAAVDAERTRSQETP